MTRNIGILVVLLVLATQSAALAWGKDGHQWIVGAAAGLLPDTQAATMREYYLRYIYRRVMAPDQRKSQDETEAPKHFLDVEDYAAAGLSAAAMPWDMARALKAVGTRRFGEYGQGPWAVQETYEQLVAALRARDWATARRMFADISHYVGDLAQPLHTTRNYDGQMTGQRGVHGRFEMDLLQRCLSEVPKPAGAVPVPGDPLAAAFALVRASNSRVDAVMAADRTATWDPALYDNTYYRTFQAEIMPVMVASLHDGARVLAAYYLAALVEAERGGVVTDSTALAGAEADPEVNFVARDAEMDRGWRRRERREHAAEPRPLTEAQQSRRFWLIVAGVLTGGGGLAVFLLFGRRLFPPPPPEQEEIFSESAPPGESAPPSLFGSYDESSRG